MFRKNLPPEKKDATRPWLDFGRWLAGESLPEDGARSDAWADHHFHGLPSFADIVRLHFRDLVQTLSLSRGQKVLSHSEAWGEADGSWMENRRAMHRRFIAAVHLAFGPDDLNTLAARQPPPVFRLIRQLRADFGLITSRPIPHRHRAAFRPDGPVSARH